MSTDAVFVPASIAELNDKLQSCVNPVLVPSLAWGIFRGGDLEAYSHGLANKETGLSATPGIPFAMASVTKPMTTTAIALLASRGLVDLDAPINDYLGDAKIQSRVGEASLATVRAVADHSAGLPLHYQFYYEDEPYGRPPFEETIRRYAKTFTSVGLRHQYSNLGYGLLDYIIERVSGRPYAEFMATEVFGPLGMESASIGAPKEADYAKSYGPDGVAYPRYDLDHPGGSATYASVADLLKFARFQLGHGPEILSRDRLEDMHRISSRISETRGYGLGWGVNSNRFGYKIVEHTGFMGGVSAVLRLVPQENLAIAIVANGQTDLTWKSADDAMAAILPDYREGILYEKSQPPKEPVIGPATVEYVGNWRGKIETHDGDRAFELDVLGPFEAYAAVDGKSVPVRDLQLRDGRLLGVLEGDVKTADASRRPYLIHLDLGFVGKELKGAANTITKTIDGGGGAPGKRFGNALAYYVELKG